MRTEIFSLSVYGLTTKYPDGLHFRVGQRSGQGEITSIIFRQDIYKETGERVYSVKRSVPDEDNPRMGGNFLWQQIELGSMHTVIVTFNTETK